MELFRVVIDTLCLYNFSLRPLMFSQKDKSHPCLKEPDFPRFWGGAAFDKLRINSVSVLGSWQTNHNVSHSFLFFCPILFLVWCDEEAWQM